MSLFQHTPHKHKPRNINVIHEQEQGFNQRLAVLITKGFGSMVAFYILVAWMLIWMLLATLGIWLFAKDSYPFSFLLFLSNLIQLWALPILSVGQNVLSRKAELQADEAYQATLKSFHDIEQIMLHLQEQDQELLKQSSMLVELLQKTAKQ